MVGVEVNGVWNQDSTTVTINASIDSYVSGNYEIAYVLIADSLTGAGSSWRQGNYYAQQYTKQQLINSGEEDLAILGKGGDKGSSYIQWDFMDVLIGSSYRNTTNQAAPITLTANETTTASYEVAMPTKAALKNALKATGRKVAAIAIIIDKQTGQVVNAGKSYNITAATGIQGVTLQCCWSAHRGSGEGSQHRQDERWSHHEGDREVSSTMDSMRQPLKLA